MKRLVVVLMLVGLVSWPRPTQAHGLQKKEDLVKAAVGLGLLLTHGNKLEQLIGRFSTQVFEQENEISDDPEKNARVKRIFDRLVAANGRPGLKYSVKIVDRSDINAYSLLGGNIYVSSALLDIPGLTDDELSSPLAHELAHVNTKHGMRHFQDRLGSSLLLGSLGDEGLANLAAALATQLYTSGRSRSDEKQADQLGFDYVVKAGFQPSAPLSFMRRLETESVKNPDPFEQLLATHPPISERSETQRNRFLATKFGWDAVELVGHARAAGPNDPKDGWDNTDPAWIEAFATNTGWVPLRLENYFSGKYRGECTWFALASRSDSIPVDPKGGNDAHTWAERCKKAGYAVGKEAKRGALRVWGREVGGGHGHLALVSKIRPDKMLEVWDSNWGPESKDKNYLNGRVRHRLIKEDGKAVYIYWPNSQTDPPDNSTAEEKGRDQILILRGPIYLGDDREALTIWPEKFGLTAADLTGRTKARLSLKVRAIPGRDPIIYLDIVEIGRIVARSDRWTQYSFPVDLAKLWPGEHIMTLETIVPHIWQSYDDCEIKDVILSFN